jgi:hypothetical protein
MDNNINLDPQQIQQMIMMLQAMLPKQDGQESSGQSDTKSKKKSPRSNNKNKPTITKTSTNKFDSMMEKRMHMEDIEIDKKLIVQPPVPRARAFNLVNVVCRVCGKRESVNPVLITDSIDRYKCNKCSGAAG